MTPIKQAGVWLIQFVSFLTIFSIIYIAFPYVYMFEVYSNKVGFIAETDWSDLVLLGTLVVSLLINTLMIFLIASVKRK